MTIMNFEKLMTINYNWPRYNTRTGSALQVLRYYTSRLDNDAEWGPETLHILTR
jgi:hypothetical protein